MTSQLQLNGKEVTFTSDTSISTTTTMLERPRYYGKGQSLMSRRDSMVIFMKNRTLTTYGYDYDIQYS